MLTHIIKERFDHEASKQALKEKYQAKMIFAHQGGMFRAGPDLIAVLSTVQQDTMIIVDLYDTPVKVVRQGLLDSATQRWQEQLNAWMEEHNQLTRER